MPLVTVAFVEEQKEDNFSDDEEKENEDSDETMNRTHDVQTWKRDEQ